LLWLALTGLAVALLLALLVALVWGLGRVLDLLAPVVWPLAVAGVLAYLLDPVVHFFQRKGVPRTRAIVVVFVLAVFLVGALFASVVPQMIAESKQFSAKIPAQAENVRRSIEQFVAHPPGWMQKFIPRDTPLTNLVANTPPVDAAPANGTNAPASTLTTSNSLSVVAGVLLGKIDVGTAAEWFSENVPRTLGRLFGAVSTRVAGFFGVLAGLALVPVYLFYFLLEKKGIAGKWQNYLPLAKSELRDEVAFVIQSINDCLIVFFRGQVLVAICDGVLYTIGFLIIGLPYAVLLGVMATFLTMIPFLGAILTCGAALAIAFAQYGDWQHPATVLGVFAVVQTLEGFVIQPKIIGDRIGLHPLTIIVALMVGTTLLGGILGGILAIPLTAALRVVMFRYVWKARETSAG
jgi:predicted PurR-regulated permease PerM